MEPSSGLDSELESFRQQWLSDLRTKKDEQQPSSQHGHGRASQRTLATSTTRSASTSPVSPRKPRARPASPTKTRKPALAVEEEDEFLHGMSFDELPQPAGNTIDGSVKQPPAKELVSALDHYEEAMEKEAQGNMGDSLKLYRQAYRLDHGVDRRYREKHFPQGAPKSSASQTTTTSAPTGTQHSSAGVPAPDSQAAQAAPVVLSIQELIASFSGLNIERAPPQVEGSPPPPCPIADLPHELLIHIMLDVAAADVGDFVRLSLVCKQFAYLVATEQRTWRSVSLGTTFGFTGMHYHWNRTIAWQALEGGEQELEDGTVISMSELAERRLGESILVTKSLVPSPYATWKNMFRSRPRIRFNGCYISTVNYVRTGLASTNQATWSGAPIHIVTYYRYLRCYRDGTAISLLTTDQPSDVVHHLTKDMLTSHRDMAHSYLPSAIMQRAYKGRWRLSSTLEASSDGPNEGPQEEGDLTVETEGVDSKYMYRMELSMRTVGKAAKNNKLAWKSFFSYNRLTDDWAEFTLKHDKQFFFSRVRSYGIGE